MSEPAKAESSWSIQASIAVGIIGGVALALGLVCGELSSDLRRSETAYERLRESRDAQTRELELRHESARECCRSAQGGYAACVQAFGIGASK